VAYAAREGTLASDGTGSGNSPYAAALIKYLREPGLEIRLMFGRVRDEVMAATGKAQEPFVYGSLGGEALYVNPPDDQAGDGIAADYALAERVGTAAAWEAFLTRHGSEAGNFYVELAVAARQKLELAALAP